MRSAPSLRSFPNVAFETVSVFVWLTMAFPRPFNNKDPYRNKDMSVSQSMMIVQRFLCPRLSPPGHRWSVGSVSRSSTLHNYLPNSKPLVRDALPAWQSSVSHGEVSGAVKSLLQITLQNIGEAFLIWVIQFSLRWYLCAPKSPYAIHPVYRFPNVAFETVPMFVWLTMAFPRPFKEDRLALPLSTPLSSRRSMVWCPWLCARR